MLVRKESGQNSSSTLKVILHSPQISNFSSSSLSSDLNGNFPKRKKVSNNLKTNTLLFTHPICNVSVPEFSFKVSLIHTMQNCSSSTSVKFLTALQLLMKFNGRLGWQCRKVYTSNGTGEGMWGLFHVKQPFQLKKKKWKPDLTSSSTQFHEILISTTYARSDTCCISSDGLSTVHYFYPISFPVQLLKVWHL